MTNKIDENVLFIGIDYRTPKGGVASVEHEYARQFKPFKFVRTSVSGGKIVKALVAAEGIVKFTCKLLVDRNIKIVHVNAASDASFWRKRIFINVAKLFGKKILYHNHGGGFKRFYGEHPTAVNRTLAKADCVVALSESWREFFANALGCKRVEVVNNPVTPPVETLHPSDQFRADGPMRLLFMGAITRNKGIFDLIEVLSANREEYEGKVVLHVGGNGDVDTFTNFISAHHLDKLVKFEGWVDGHKKDQLFRNSDVYILPSYFEGLPISILEAMTYGKPIIASNVGGIPEILHDGINGLLITPGDKPAIKQAIDRLLSSADVRKSMGAKGMEMAKPFYSSEVAATLRKLYESLLTK